MKERVIPHSTTPPSTMLCEADSELEMAGFATEVAFWHGLRGDTEDLERTDTERENAVHSFLV